MSCSQTHTSNAWLSTTCVIQSLLNACLFSIQSHTTHDEKLSDPSTQYNLIFFSSFAGCFKADFLKGTNNRNRTTRKSKGWITPLFFTQNLLPITQSPAGQTHHYTNCAFTWIDPNFKKIFNQMYWRYRSARETGQKTTALRIFLTVPTCSNVEPAVHTLFQSMTPHVVTAKLMVHTEFRIHSHLGFWYGFFWKLMMSCSE